MFPADRGLVDRPTHDLDSGRHRTARGNHPAATGRHHRGSFGPWRPISLTPLPAHAAGPWADRIYGSDVIRGDDAAMESLFSLLQKNVLNRQTWTTRDELRLKIITWIEHTYQRRRRQRALGRLTPIEFVTVFGYNQLAEAA